MYSTTLIGFAALAAGVSVPIANAFGGGWRPGLAFWAIPAAIALLVWAPQLARRQSVAGAPGDQVAGARSLLHDKVAWAVTMFFAIQSAGFYTTLAWLPSVFHSHGASSAKAGLLLSIGLFVGLIPAITVPTMAARVRDQRAFVWVFVVCIAAGWIGVIVAPMGAPYSGRCCSGSARTGVPARAHADRVPRRDGRGARRPVDARTDGRLPDRRGGAVRVGAVHDVTGSWTPALFMLMALLVPQLVSAWRPRATGGGAG